MKKELLEEVKVLLESGELTREEVLLSLFTDEDGDLYLSWLDFSDFEGNVWVSGFKVKRDLRLNDNMVKGNLWQNNCVVEGDLFQSYHEVKGNLYQWEHNVKGDLHQYNHTVGGDLNQGKQKVEGNYYATNIKVKGKIDFEEPTKILKKITLKELKEMGYELEEEK